MDSDDELEWSIHDLVHAPEPPSGARHQSHLQPSNPHASRRHLPFRSQSQYMNASSSPRSRSRSHDDSAAPWNSSDGQNIASGIRPRLWSQNSSSSTLSLPMLNALPHSKSDSNSPNESKDASFRRVAFAKDSNRRLYGLERSSMRQLPDILSPANWRIFQKGKRK